MKYWFKRDFYEEVRDSIKKNKVSFLLGPRKCGKTVCLQQIKDAYPDAEYFSFKNMPTEDSIALFNRIYESIKNNESKLYLLDEITYAYRPDAYISQLSDYFSEYETDNVKLVLTGSQSVALKQWGHIAFAGSAGYIESDFLTYSEWNRYNKLTGASEASFERFLLDTEKFYNFSSLKDYLESCLDETVRSNAKALNIIYGNDSDGLNSEVLLDICYASMYSLNAHSKKETFFKKDKIYNDMLYYFSGKEGFASKDLADKIAASCVAAYNHLQNYDDVIVAKALYFLQKSKLVTVTPFADSLDSATDFNRYFSDIYYGRTPNISFKETLFNQYNVFMRYPMFLIAVYKDILKEQMPEKMNNALKGNILECYVRSFLPEKDSFELHTEKEEEIDYINPITKEAVEITCFNKDTHSVHLDILPDNYRKILLSKNRYDQIGGIYRVPYYLYVYNNCNFDKCRLYAQDLMPHSVLNNRTGIEFDSQKENTCNVTGLEKDEELIQNVLFFPSANLNHKEGNQVVHNIAKTSSSQEFLQIIASGNIEGQQKFYMTNSEVMDVWKDIVSNPNCSLELAIDIAVEIMLNKDKLGIAKAKEMMGDVSLRIKDKDKSIAGIIYGYANDKTNEEQTYVMITAQLQQQGLKSIIHSDNPVSRDNKSNKYIELISDIPDPKTED